MIEFVTNTPDAETEYEQERVVSEPGATIRIVSIPLPTRVKRVIRANYKAGTSQSSWDDEENCESKFD